MTLPLNSAKIGLNQPESTVAAITVAYNSAHALPGCIAGLQANDIDKIIVVDNNSADASVAVAQAAGASVIRCDRNEGFGRANNRGLAAAVTDYCLLLNPDIILDPGAVAALLAAARRYPDAILLAPQIIESDGRVFFQPRALLSGFLPNLPRKNSGTLTLPTGDCSVPFLSGACYLVRREALLALGGFDPNIFLFYEDDDLCRRMTDAGQPPLYVPAAIARHGRGKSTGANTKAERTALQYKIRWHMAWSRFYVLRKYGLLREPDVISWRRRFFWKLLAARMLGNALKTARYRGSYDGARLYMRGEPAFQADRNLDAIDRKLS